MTLVFIILAITVVLLLVGKIPMEIAAFGGMLALFAFGILDVDQILDGFSNATVVTIAALFVVGGGLFRTGVAEWLARRMLRVSNGNATRLTGLLVVLAAGMSAFLSNTGTVALLMPAVVSAANRLRKPAGLFLLPMAFAAQIGGLLTLVATPPNIVLANTLQKEGLAPFGFFEFAALGLPLLVAYLAFTLLLGRRFTAVREGDEGATVQMTPEELRERYDLTGRLFVVRVRRGSDLDGATLEEANLSTEWQVQLLDLVLPHATDRGLPGMLERITPPTAPVRSFDPRTKLVPDTALIVAGDPERVHTLTVALGLGLTPLADSKEARQRRASQEIGLAEVLLPARSSVIGQTVTSTRFRNRYRVDVLGIRRGSKALPIPFHATKLRFGDTLLVYGTWDSIELLRRDKRNYIVMGGPESLDVEPALTVRAVLATLVLAGMVLLMLTGAVPTVVATLLAAAAMIVTGCLKMEDAYRAVSWESVMLIACMLPMSTALEVTGGAAAVANGLVSTVSDLHPVMILAAVFVLSAAFSQFISNTASTVLLAPIAFRAATSLGLSPYPVFMMVAAGASSAFLTPMASPVNMLVIGPGNYRFGDFARLGLPLLLLVLGLSLLIVPLIWSLTP